MNFIKLFTLTYFFIISNSSAFILNKAPGWKLGPQDEFSVYLNETSCVNHDNTLDELADAIKYTIENHWNSVSGSSLHLNYEGLNSVPWSFDLSLAIPGRIVIGCDTLTAAGISIASDDGGAVIVLHIGEGTFDGLVGLISHEMGHAIGLGHSDDPSSVMTYNTDQNYGNNPPFLSRDDKEGVRYLYPLDGELGGLFGGCESFASSGRAKPSFIGFLGTLMFYGLAFVFFRRLFYVVKGN